MDDVRPDAPSRFGGPLGRSLRPPDGWAAGPGSPATAGPRPPAWARTDAAAPLAAPRLPSPVVGTGRPAPVAGDPPSEAGLDATSVRAALRRYGRPTLVWAALAFVAVATTVVGVLALDTGRPAAPEGGRVVSAVVADVVPFGASELYPIDPDGDGARLVSPVESGGATLDEDAAVWVRVGADGKVAGLRAKPLWPGALAILGGLAALATVPVALGLLIRLGRIRRGFRRGLRPSDATVRGPIAPFKPITAGTVVASVLVSVLMAPFGRAVLYHRRAGDHPFPYLVVRRPVSARLDIRHRLGAHAVGPGVVWVPDAPRIRAVYCSGSDRVVRVTRKKRG